MIQTRKATARIVNTAETGVENRFARAQASGPRVKAGGGIGGLASVRRKAFEP